MVLDTPPHLAVLPPATPTGTLGEHAAGTPSEQATGPLGEQATARASQQPAGPVLWLVRHGESTWNAQGLAQGHCDQPRLTSRGIRQARDAAGQLRGRPIGAVYTSDLQRAVATAAPLAAVLGLDFTRDSRLRERCLGVLEGTRAVTVPAALSGVAGRRVIDPDARPPDGESLRDLYWRVAGFADHLLAVRQAPSAGPGEIAVVAHGGTLRVLTAYLRGVPVERMTWEPIGNGCILRLQPHQPACS
jgi:probable phosphoglycerate mutase